jgi:hypothetical protein
MQNDLAAVLARIDPGDKVLDAGAWNDVIPRADAVIDINPYETRTNRFPDQREHFSKDTWIQDDLNLPEAWSRFRDGEFDFAICSHLLEDVRDPLFVCRQLIRVAKAGYIECPSRFRECAKSYAGELNSGYNHHRWILDLIDGALVFTPKLGWAHFIDYLGEARRHYLQDRRSLFVGVFWQGPFDYYERFPKGDYIETASLFYFYDHYDHGRTPHIFEIGGSAAPAPARAGRCVWITDYVHPVEAAGTEIYEAYLARSRAALDGLSGAPYGVRPLRYQAVDRVHAMLLRTPGLRRVPRALARLVRSGGALMGRPPGSSIGPPR